eukprot:3780985-Pleurochrysis_carterae.AAC.2
MNAAFSGLLNSNGGGYLLGAKAATNRRTINRGSAIQTTQAAYHPNFTMKNYMCAMLAYAVPNAELELSISSLCAKHSSHHID